MKSRYERKRDQSSRLWRKRRKRMKERQKIANWQRCNQVRMKSSNLPEKEVQEGLIAMVSAWVKAAMQRGQEEHKPQEHKHQAR